MSSDLFKRFGINSLSDLTSQVSDGFFGTDYLKDYSHASKLMRPNGLALAPKQKFLFHVYFNTADPSNFLKDSDKGLVGALVKSVQLPSFRLDTQEYIQYNRKRLVHNKITYEPITIKLHDDGSGNVLDLWYNYYQYYFADASYEYDTGMKTSSGINSNSKGNYNDRDLYSPTRTGQTRGWGKTITSTLPAKPAFFKDIQIYGLNRGNAVSYTLINPVITSWQHDTYDYADTTGLMEHTMTVQYEAVKYFTGPIVSGGENVNGFAVSSRYDQEPGALGPGSTTSTFGQGGLLDTADSIGADLANGNLLGAVQKAGASAKSFENIETLRNVVSADSIDAVKGSILSATGGQPSRLLNFPVPGAVSGNSIAASPKKGG